MRVRWKTIARSSCSTRSRSRMPFRDGQYLDSPSISRLAAALEEIIYRSTANTLVMPLGLHHADHALVHDACCEILPRLSHLRGLPTKMRSTGASRASWRRALTIWRNAASWRRRPIRRPIIRSTPERQASLKREAVAAYESQLRVFGPQGYEDVFNAEHYWQLSVSRAPVRRSHPAR